MRRLAWVLLPVLLLLLAVNTVSARGNPYPRGQCVWYAAKKRPDLLVFRAYAKDWDNKARKHDFPVKKRPKVGAVVVFEPGVRGAHSIHGHVGYVERVISSTKCEISELNWGLTKAARKKVNRRVISTGPGISFIYRKPSPKPKPKPTATPTSRPTPVPTATPSPTLVPIPTPKPTPTPTLTATPAVGGILPPGKIIFSRSNQPQPPDIFWVPHDLYIMNSDGSAIRRITELDGAYRGKSISPDLQWIAFSFELDVYKVRLDGTGLTQLTFNPDYDVDPAWSPDGTLIAFSSQREGGFTLWTMAVDGSNQSRLTSDPVGYMHEGPAWSPDSQWLVFSSTCGSGDLFIVSRDGSQLRKLTGGDTCEELVPQDGGAAWSPDGQWIAFSRNEPPFPKGPTHIWVMRVDGTEIYDLTHDFCVAGSPSWTPDSEWIVFQGIRHGSCVGVPMDIFVVKKDGTVLIQLTDDRYNDADPIWVP